MKLLADNRGFNDPLTDSKQALKELGDEAKKTGGGVRNLGQDLDAHVVLFKRYQAEAKASAKALIEKQRALRMVGIQLGDVSQQLALGVNPAIIFGQQIGQVGLAAEGLGGRLGAVAKFMSSPWGAAVQLAVIGLGFLISNLLKTEDSAKKAAKATDIHRMSAEELTKAINDQNVALGKAIQTSKEAEDAAYRSARAILNETIKRRDNIKSILDEQKAILQAQVTRATGPTQASEIAALSLGRLQDRIKETEASLKANAADIANAQTGVRLADVPRMAREVKVATDQLAAAEDRHTNTLARLNGELSKVGANRAAIKQQLIDEENRYNRETEALRKNTKVRKENNDQIGQSLSSGAARKLVEAAGGRVTDDDRTFAEQKRLYDRYLAGGNLAAKPGHGMHEQGRALDVVGLSIAKIREIFREAGVRIVELKKYADGHIHVAWAKSAGEAKLFNEQLRDQKAEAREAEKALEDLQRTLDDLTRRFDPAKSAANDYAKTLADIAKVQAGGLISQSDALLFGVAASKAVSDADLKAKNEQMARFFADELGRSIDDDLVVIGARTGREIALSFGETAADVAVTIGNLIGGRVGNVIGGIGQLIGSRQKDSPLQKDIAGISDGIAKLATGINIDPKSAKKLGDLVGGAAGGAATGAMVAGIGKSIWGKFSSTGSQIGGAIGGMTGIPGGDIIGSILGGIVGGLMKKAKKGTATVTDVYGDITGTGNSASRIKAAETLGTSIQGGIQQIADALGGTLGSFAVSIGVRGKKFVVDPSGSGKTKGGGVLKFKDENDALAAAMRDAIADGAVQGLSAAVQKALTSSSDIDKALREALKVKDLETLLEGIGGEIGAVFRDFDRQAAERVRIATKYGFDLVKLEKLNAEQRAKLFDDILGSKIGALKDLLDEINFGDLFEGSAVERLAKLWAEADKANADLAAGIEGAGDKLAGINRDILGLSREAFGTAGPEFAGDLAAVKSATERAIQMESDRVKAAADAQQATNDALNENNDQNAQMIAKLTNIEGLLGGGGTTPGFATNVDTGFTGSLNLNF